MFAYQPPIGNRLQTFVRRSVLTIGLFALASGSISSLAQATETMLVHVDQAKILRIEQPAGTIIVGNPMIADATVQDERMLVITGKSFGSTNLIILDRNGEEILSTNLEVRFAAASQVTIQRGTGRFSYSCSPTCEPVLAIGDQKEQFDAVKEAITGRIDTASGKTSEE